MEELGETEGTGGVIILDSGGNGEYQENTSSAWFLIGL